MTPWLPRASSAAAGLAALLGGGVLLGYALDRPGLVRMRPNWPPMYPLTALVFILGGVAVLAVRRPLPRRGWVVLSRVTSLAVLLVGVGILVAHLFDLDRTPFDVWVSGVVEPTTPIAGRPVAETGIAFTVLGGALTLHTARRAVRATQALALGGLTVGAAALIGYVLQVDRAALGRTALGIGMAFPTGLGILALGVAVLLARPRAGLLDVVLAAGTVGRLTRRVLAAALVAPIGFAVMDGILIDWAGETRTSRSIVATVNVLFVVGVVILLASALERYAVEAATAQELRERDLEAAAAAVRAEAAIASHLRHPFPEVAHWVFAERHEPAAGYVTGDSVQVLGGAERFWIVVIDVAGHGVESGLVAVQLRARVATLHGCGATPTEAASALCEATREAGTLASALIIAVDARTGAVEYVNAGHPAAVVVGRPPVRFLGTTGPVFGVVDGRYRTETEELGVGEQLVLYSDGLTESRQGSGELYGEERAVRLIELAAVDGPDRLAQTCIDAARQHAGGRLRDDVLVVVAQRTG